MCHIGYMGYMEVRIPAPQPLEFKKKFDAPKINAELLRNLGEEDAAFAEWASTLSVDPLLNKALQTALSKVPNNTSVNFSIKNGNLTAEALYDNDTQRAKIQKIAAAVADNFQMEVIAIIADLLDFEAPSGGKVRVKKDGNGFLVHGEKGAAVGGARRSIKVAKKSGEKFVIEFEHFMSQTELDSEIMKFESLAQKMGLPIAVAHRKDTSAPIPNCGEDIQPGREGA